jgi:hypothetical protein
MNQVVMAINRRAQADKKLAEALDKGYALHGENGKEVLTNLYNGLVRASWYSSCLFEDYQDTCEKLRSEDKQFLKSIITAYSKDDAVYRILSLFFQYVFSSMMDSQIDNIYRRMKQDPFLRTQIHGFAVMASGNVTKNALTSGLMSLAVNSAKLSRLASFAAKLTSGAFSVLEHYGELQRRVQAADNLKLIDQHFYNILCREHLETYWYFVEGLLRPHLTTPPRTEDEAYKAITQILLDIK